MIFIISAYICSKCEHNFYSAAQLLKHYIEHRTAVKNEIQLSAKKISNLNLIKEITRSIDECESNDFGIQDI